VSRAPTLRRPLVVFVGTVALSASLLTPASAADHSTLVGVAPSERSPDIKDGYVGAIWDAGPKVIAGGTFTTVENRKSDVPIKRTYLVAFDKATGTVDTAFAPVIDDEVTAVLDGPTPGTVFIAGAFGQVNGVNRPRTAVLNLSNGSLVTAWKGPAMNSRVNDAVRVGVNYLLGGAFTVVGQQSRLGLASITAADGKLNDYLTTPMNGHHNWTGPGSGASSPVGPDKLAASPDGKKLVAIGNFKSAGGVLHDQIVKFDLGPTAATIANWNTDQYQPRCVYQAFDSWVRDVAFAPDSSYFVVVSTGAAVAGTLCDSAAAWNANETSANARPMWVNFSGGDTLLSVTVTSKAVYVGGHIRWLNNSFGRDSAGAGAVGRASIAALDPLNGLPLAWNPGRRPRGYGVTELYATADGLWIGHDSSHMGNYEYRRERIAFLPLAGGYTPHATTVATLPGKVYQAGSVPGAGVNDISARTYSGSGAASARTPVANLDGTAWSSARGAFWVGGTLFYGAGSALYRRTFDGVSFGSPALVDPYHDPKWSTVPTDGPAGQTFVGVNSNFYAEIPSVTGMFYAGGRLFYTLSGQSGLFWRWFTPDSGVVGADKFAVTGATGFTDAGGVFVSGGRIYMVHRTTGQLWSRTWTDSAPDGVWVLTEGQDWRGRAVFVAP
jgi:hypothetical protein